MGDAALRRTADRPHSRPCAGPRQTKQRSLMGSSPSTRRRRGRCTKPRGSKCTASTLRTSCCFHRQIKARCACSAVPHRDGETSVLCMQAHVTHYAVPVHLAARSADGRVWCCRSNRSVGQRPRRVPSPCTLCTVVPVLGPTIRRYRAKFSPRASAVFRSNTIVAHAL